MRRLALVAAAIACAALVCSNPSATFACEDSPLSGGASWVDSYGDGCDWYDSGDSTNCDEYGASANADELNADQACCTCSGGDSDACLQAETGFSSSDTCASRAQDCEDPTYGPSLQSCCVGSCSNADPPPLPTPTPTPPPPPPPPPLPSTAAPTILGCIDNALSNGSPFQDSFGDGCSWYEGAADGCAQYGAIMDAGGETSANAACCVCGGGGTAAPTSAAPTTPAPTSGFTATALLAFEGVTQEEAQTPAFEQSVKTTVHNITGFSEERIDINVVSRRSVEFRVVINVDSESDAIQTTSLIQVSTKDGSLLSVLADNLVMNGYSDSIPTDVISTLAVGTATRAPTQAPKAEEEDLQWVYYLVSGLLIVGLCSLVSTTIYREQFRYNKMPTKRIQAAIIIQEWWHRVRARRAFQKQVAGNSLGAEQQALRYVQHAVEEAAETRLLSNELTSCAAYDNSLVHVKEDVSLEMEVTEPMEIWREDEEPSVGTASVGIIIEPGSQDADVLNMTPNELHMKTEPHLHQQY